MDNNEIKKYIVKITYNGFGGSGVIVPLSSTSEFFYIFTAKHTFFEKGTDIHNMNIANIEDSIIVENPIEGNIVVKKDDIQSDINKVYDLLVFRISIEFNSWIKDLNPISIFSDNFRNCTVMGYPNVREKKDTKYDAFACLYKQQNDKPYIFEMDSNKLLTTHRDKDLNPKDTMAGISGSGVFVKGSTKELYLVGIQIQSTTQNALIAIDLREIFDELNEKLDNTLTLGGYQFFEEIGLDIKKLEFDDLMDKLNNDDELKEIKKHDDFYSEIDFLEQSNYRDNMNRKYNNLQIKMKKLSDVFLYQGIVFHKKGKHQQATNRFKKAITLYPDYKHYFAKAKFERDKRTEEQKKAKEKIDKESTFSDDIDMVIETFKSDIEKYKKDENAENLIEIYRKIIPLLSISFDEKNNGLIDNFSKDLARVLITNSEFIEAENILLKMEDNEVASDLYKIYTNEEYTKRLNNEEVAKKLFDLLALMEDESKKDKIRKKIDDLNLYNKNMLVLNEEFSTMKYQIKDYQSKIETLTGMLVNGTKNQDILEQVLQTDENISKKIDERTNDITKKLDEVKTTIIKTNNQKLNNFLDNVYRSNQSLVSKIQTMYHQNDRVNKKAKIALDNSIKSMNEKIENYLSKPIESTNNMAEIKKIIESSNWNFYKGIQGLYEKESDSYTRKLLEMSIAFTKREHELHIENLKESHQNELLKVKEEANTNNSKKLSHISEQVGKSHKKLDNISGQLNKFQSSFIQTIQENNQNLIDEIEKRFPKIKGELEPILNTNKEEIKTVINLPIKHVKKVVEICNRSFFSKVEAVFKKNKELSLLLEITKKDNKKAVLELERQYQDIKTLETKSKTLESEIEKKEQKNQELIPYKKKHEDEEKLKSKREKDNEKFMERIKLRASLKNKLSYTFNYFHRVEEKIQALTSEFDNDLKELYDEVKNIEKDIEKFSKEKNFDMIQEMELKIEGKKTIFFKKIEDDIRTKKEKDKYIKIVVFLVFITILIGVSIEVFLRL